MNYVFGRLASGPRAAVLGALQGVEDDYELLKGVSRQDGWPDDAHFRMSDDFPQNLLLEDVLSNQNKLLVASQRTRDLFVSEGVLGNEYLPVRIVNHKGREEDAPYYVVHQVGHQACIDEAASEFMENPIDPERLFYVSRLVIDESRVDPEARLFRLARFAQMPIFRRDLAAAFTAAGLTGLGFGELSEWSGM